MRRRSTPCARTPARCQARSGASRRSGRPASCAPARPATWSSWPRTRRCRSPRWRAPPRPRFRASRSWRRARWASGRAAAHLRPRRAALGLRLPAPDAVERRPQTATRVEQARVPARRAPGRLPLVEVDAGDARAEAAEPERVLRAQVRVRRAVADRPQHPAALVDAPEHDAASLGEPDLPTHGPEQRERALRRQAVGVGVVVDAPDPRLDVGGAAEAA